MTLSQYFLAALAIALGLSLVGLNIQTSRLDAVKTEFATFQANVKALGDVAAAQAKDKELKDVTHKKEIDDANAKLRTTNAILNKRLRDARASGSYVPSAPAGSTSPDRASFDRTELERAIQQLDAGVQGLIEKGDKAIIDNDSAKKWAQDSE